MSDEKTLSLEEMFTSLDEVIEQLEGEDVSLEASFSLYHKGMDLLKHCNEQIDRVEKQVQVLDEDGDTGEL